MLPTFISGCFCVGTPKIAEGLGDQALPLLPVDHPLERSILSLLLSEQFIFFSDKFYTEDRIFPPTGFSQSFPSVNKVAEQVVAFKFGITREPDPRRSFVSETFTMCAQVFHGTLIDCPFIGQVRIRENQIVGTFSLSHVLNLRVKASPL